jgi:hypothetical protein
LHLPVSLPSRFTGDLEIGVSQSDAQQQTRMIHHAATVQLCNMSHSAQYCARK